MLTFVIIPAGAAEATIAACVKSFLARTYPDWETSIVLAG
jgi:hypothetical protein